MHTSVGKLSDGKFYWFATEDYQMFERVIIQNDPEAINAQEFHGPFNTREEAARAADIAIAGEYVGSGVVQTTMTRGRLPGAPLASALRLPVAYSSPRCPARRRSCRRPMNHPTMNTAHTKATITPMLTSR
jgi:hypothetical protein